MSPRVYGPFPQEFPCDIDGNFLPWLRENVLTSREGKSQFRDGRFNFGCADKVLTDRADAVQLCHKFGLASEASDQALEFSALSAYVLFVRDGSLKARHGSRN